MAFSMMYGTGFEMGTISGLLVDGDLNNASIGTTKKTGTYGLKLTGYFSGYAKFREVDGTPTELYVGVWVRPHPTTNSAYSSRIYLYCNDGGYIYLEYINPYWRAYHSDNGVIATGTVETNSSEWHHVQIRLSIDNTTGILQTKIDGIDDIDFSGDTLPGTATSISYIQLQQANTSTTNRSGYFDDFCFGSGGWPGDIRFDALMPDGDTATINWTGSDGDQVDNYALINERPPSDADYVESTVTGQKDKYTLGDFDGTNKNPLAVVLWARAMKDEADAHQLKLILDDGTEDVGAGIDLLTSYMYKYRLDETKPSGGDWTDADIDGLDVGLESVIV